jgi:hypothetical protein
MQQPEAADILRQLRVEADEQYALAEERDDSMGMAIWARANEKARRLALVYACCERSLGTVSFAGTRVRHADRYAVSGWVAPSWAESIQHC